MSFTINAVGRSILASSRRCTGRVGACRLRGEAGAFGLGQQRVLLQQARSSWSTPSLGLRGDLAGSLSGVGVKSKRCPVLIRSASSRGNGEVIVIRESAWKEILDPHAPEYDMWVGVHTDDGKGTRKKIVDVSHNKSTLFEPRVD